MSDTQWWSNGVAKRKVKWFWGGGDGDPSLVLICVGGGKQHFIETSGGEESSRRKGRQGRRQGNTGKEDIGWGQTILTAAPGTLMCDL